MNSFVQNLNQFTNQNLFPGFQIHFVQILQFLQIVRLEIVQKNELFTLTLVFVQKFKMFTVQIIPCFQVSVSFCRNHKILTNPNLFTCFPVLVCDQYYSKH